MKNSAEQSVKHLTRENFNAYPEDWKKGNIILRDLAHGYWETRKDNEVERDEKFCITEEDYYDFVCEVNDEICSELDWY